jgi:ketosteroid isomerase-like protein
MSVETVDLVRAGLDAFLSGDLERARGMTHPEAVTVRHPPLPDAQSYHGFEGVVRAYADWTTDFDEYEMRPDEFIDAGDRVVVDVFQRGRGRASGAVVEARVWLTYWVDDGKIVRMEIFNERQQALRAAGMPE